VKRNLAADKRRYTQIIQQLNRQDAEDAEEEKSLTAKTAEDAKEDKSFTAKTRRAPRNIYRRKPKTLRTAARVAYGNDRSQETNCAVAVNPIK